jgi:hypothetical protein
MTTYTIWHSDFKDFRGLNEVCRGFDVIERNKNHLIVKNYSGDRTPFDVLNAYPPFAEECKYNLVLKIAKEEGFNVEAIKWNMDNLIVSPERFYRCLCAAICYPKGHVNRDIGL